jgi:lipopolysaccharide export system permease protein
LVLGLFSVPIACVFRALKQQHGLVLALGVFLVYYSLLALAEGMGETRPQLAAVGVWMPNVLFGFTGMLFLRQAVRERVPAKVLWAIRRLQPKGAA